MLIRAFYQAKQNRSFKNLRIRKKRIILVMSAKDCSPDSQRAGRQSAPFAQRTAVRAFDQEMREMLQTPGVRSVGLVAWRDGRTLARVGAEDRSADAEAILRAVHSGPLWAVGDLEDVVVTESDHHLLLAVLDNPDLCLQVWMVREEGNLGYALRRLRRLARTIRAPSPPPPPRDGDLPPRHDGDRSRPAGRAVASVDRRVLERVLTALRTLSVDRSRTGAVVA